MSDTSGLRAPTSADPRHLQRWAFELVQRLRTRAEATDNSAQNALDDIIETYGTITNFDDLSDAEKFALGLSQEVADALALDSDILADIQRFMDTPGLAAVHAYLRAHQNDAAVRVEQTVRQDETLSLSSQITTLTADLDAAEAAIVAEQTARADGDTALAADITSLTTTVAGNTTTISQHTASIDGIEAEWGVTISAQGQVTGLVRLDGNQSETTFTIVVDKFRVAQLDGTGIKNVFQVGTVGGTSAVALAGNMLVDGAIAAQQIAAGAVTADKVAANAITAAKIDAGAVTTAKLAAGAVTSTELDDLAVIEGKLAAGAVTETKVGTSAISEGKIANLAVSTAKIQDAAIVADKIAANAVVAAKIAAGTITADKLSVSTLSAIAANIGTVTAGRIESADGNSYWDLTTNVFQIGTP